VGTYSQCQVQLAQGGAEAYRESSRYGGSPGDKGTTVTATKPTVLTVGGPLTNSVAVNRHGRALDLSYQLSGWGVRPINCWARGGSPSLPRIGRGSRLPRASSSWLRWHLLVLMASTTHRSR